MGNDKYSKETRSPEKLESKQTLIRWQEWTNEAFERAKQESKPILLDISAVWCHWCHRLDHDTYAVPDIAEYIQTNFVPIRVDTDKRPDINRRYNLGGWPTTAFLTPEGRLIGGGTYFPPEQMRQLLRDIRSSWQKVKTQPPEETVARSEQPHQGKLSNVIVDEILGEVANNFDPIYGGFGSQPKFPQTEAQELALAKNHYSPNREILAIATATLNHVGRSGTYDQEMGGFFRYSTTRDWSVPHFEKMCEDNAKWLQLYLHAYQTTGEGFYAGIAKGIINYVSEWLSDKEQGCFYGSQDADEEYYKLPKAERLELTPPYVDEHIYTNWNAMMIQAYMDASYVLGDSRPMDFAFKSLDRLLTLNFEHGEGMYHFYDGEPHLQNQLIDQAQTAGALIHAYEYSGDKAYLTQAKELIEFTSAKLHDPDNGGLFDAVVARDSPGLLNNAMKPLDECSIAARVITKLYHLTGNAAYQNLARETLECFTETYLSFGFMSAEYAIAVNEFLHEPTVIQIVAPQGGEASRRFIAEAARLYEPRKIIQPLDPEKDAEEISLKGFSARNPAAYICVGTACTAPVTEPTLVSASVQKMANSRIKG